MSPAQSDLFLKLGEQQIHIHRFVEVSHGAATADHVAFERDVFSTVERATGENNNRYVLRTRISAQAVEKVFTRAPGMV